jgi:hypothetical protein
MSDDPTGDGMGESPFQEPPGDPADEPIGSGPAADPGPSKQFNYWGLRNSEPPISPREVGRDLDLNVDWWQHLFTGFFKQSGSDSAEAWQHYVISMILLVDQEHGILDDDGRDELEEQTDEWDDLDE